MTFTQADLTGEWDMIQLSSNATAGWVHVHASLDAAGKVTVLSFLDDTGSTTLPPPGGGMNAVIDASGTVQLTGAEGSPTFHGTMTRAKTLVVGTEDEGSPVARRNFHAWRKRVPGVTFSSADVANFNFALHAAYTGADRIWMYGTGFTGAAGEFTMSDIFDSNGNHESPGRVGTLAIDAAGVVSNVGGVLHGVMTPDKNAIFGVDTSGDVGAYGYGLLVFQRTGRSFAQADLAGDWVTHALTSGANTAASCWNHGAYSMDAAGNFHMNTFVDCYGSTTPPADRQYTISATGALTTTADASYHGQLSWEMDFWVRTMNAAAFGPSLAINTR